MILFPQRSFEKRASPSERGAKKSARDRLAPSTESLPQLLQLATSQKGQRKVPRTLSSIRLNSVKGEEGLQGMSSKRGKARTYVRPPDSALSLSLELLKTLPFSSSEKTHAEELSSTRRVYTTALSGVLATLSLHARFSRVDSNLWTV